MFFHSDLLYKNVWVCSDNDISGFCVFFVFVVCVVCCLCVVVVVFGMSDGLVLLESSQPETGRMKKKRLGAHLGLKKSSSPLNGVEGGKGLGLEADVIITSSPVSSVLKKKSDSSKGKKQKKLKMAEERGKKDKDEKDKKKKKKKKKQQREANEKDKDSYGEQEERELSHPQDDEEDDGSFGIKGKEKEKEGRERVTSSDISELEFLSEQEEDSEGEDFIGNFEFREEQPEKPFVCLQEDDIAAEQEREIQKIAELLSVSMPQAAGLLRFFKWNKDKLLTRFFDDPDGVLELAGVKVKTTPAAGSEEMGIVMVENRCSICDEEAGDDLELFALDCKHYFCALCWDQYLSMNIQEGQSGLIPCPSYDCGLLIDEPFVKQIVSEEIYAKYLLFLTKSFVDGNSQVFIFYFVF